MNNNLAFGQMVAAIEDYAIFLLDPEGIISSWNKGAAVIKGYTPDEAIGKHFSIFYTEQDLADNLPAKLLAEAVSAGKAVYEGYRKRKDGSLFFGHVTITALYDDQDQLLGFSKITRDMTASRQERLKLETSELRFKDLTQNTPGVIYQWEQKPNGETGFTYVSPKILDYFDLQPEDMQNIRQLIHPDDREEWTESVERSRVNGEDWSFEGRLMYPDGSVKWMRGKSIRSQLAPDHILYNGIMLDVSMEKEMIAIMHKQLNAQIMIESELRSSNADLEQFAYVASHDLQEPLRMVSSFLQLLKEEYSSALNEEALEYIKFAVNGAERMKRMIRDLLHYSRINNAGFKDERVDTTALVQELLIEMDEEILKKQARVRVETLPVVQANPSLLQQLFQNLIGNALKYNKSEQPLIEIGAGGQAGSFTFFVRDNGIGIAPEYHEKVFQVFQRLHNKKDYEGNGIGLSICKKIVEKHNGRIWIETAPQGGTEFRFTLS